MMDLLWTAVVWMVQGFGFAAGWTLFGGVLSLFGRQPPPRA